MTEFQEKLEQVNKMKEHNDQREGELQSQGENGVRSDPVDGHACTSFEAPRGAPHSREPQVCDVSPGSSSAAGCPSRSHSMHPEHTEESIRNDGKDGLQATPKAHGRKGPQ